METLTTVTSKNKLPGDLLIRKPDHVVVGYVMENGALHFNCPDAVLNLVYARKPFPGSMPDNGKWLTDTGITVKI